MTRVKSTITVLAAVLCFLTGAAAETTTQPATQPAKTPTVRAKVLKVVGRVQHSPIDDDKWVTTRQGDILDEGTRIRTGFRSAVQLQLHTAALVQIQSATQVALVELASGGNTEKTRIGLRYGKIRGGIIQERVDSDFQIACPVAVLTREGTWGFEMTYDPATGNYYVGLDTDGLVRVLNTVTGKRLGITPGQFVTQTMQEWFKTAEFERMVDLVDQFGVTNVEKIFYALNPGGRTAADPTGTVFAADFTRSMRELWQSISASRSEELLDKLQDALNDRLVRRLDSKSDSKR